MLKKIKEHNNWETVSNLFKKTTPCKACQKTVNKNDKTCPHCGEKYPAIDIAARKKGCLFAIAGFAFFIFFIVLIAPEEKPKEHSAGKRGTFIPLSKQNLDLSKARVYEFISWSDTSFPGRGRAVASIVSYAVDFEGFAQTAMQAAIDLQKETRAAVVTVHLAPDAETVGKGYNLAIASYAIDGLGFSGEDNWRWQVEAAKEMPSDQEREITLLWEENRDAFVVGGILNEDNLRYHIAGELGVDKEDVHLPWLMTHEYLSN